jgi:hypothetical protein
VPNCGAFGDPRNVIRLAVEAEENGWDGLFLWDHIKPPFAAGADEVRSHLFVCETAGSGETPPLRLPGTRARARVTESELTSPREPRKLRSPPGGRHRRGLHSTTMSGHRAAAWAESALVTWRM